MDLLQDTLPGTASEDFALGFLSKIAYPPLMMDFELCNEAKIVEIN